MDVYTVAEIEIMKSLEDIIVTLNDIISDISQSKWDMIKSKLGYLDNDISEIRTKVYEFNNRNLNKYDKLIGKLLDYRLIGIELEISIINKIKYVSNELLVD